MENLSQIEARELIAMLKKALVNEIQFPSKGKEIEFKVQGDSKKHIFAINIFKSRVNHLKYSINARINKNGIMLMQLHIGDTLQHMNPDRRKINGSHWHFYDEVHGTGIAIEAEDIASVNFEANTILLFERFNMVKKPKITYQLEMI
ncbi:hypothetical protein GH811_17405 [Acetobacterium malicum]|uniref:Uncharacterized protein n=1 Tax=Acetobacterium malicum TaxID=52692 RepID=A0ABR6Z1Z0_9FIRM|nr:hypothetical protein [Acetobacterium malicum]MBC3901379.1 hypothetical protein [Acetobacterium malicum]